MIFNNLFRIRLVTSTVSAACIIFCATSCANRSNHAEVAEHTAEVIGSADALYSAEGSGAGSEDTLASTQASDSQEPEEEVSIPVVEPKKIEPRKAYIEPIVRVQILGDASSIKLGSKGKLTLSFGSNFMKVEPGSRLRFKPRSARVSVRSYAVGIGTFGADEYEDAMKLAEKWKKDGYTVRLIKAGGPLLQADGTIADTTVYWVALGIFKEQQAAEKFRDRMFDRGISCWVIDESVLGPRGNIELADAKGNPLAYADSRVIVASGEPITIFDVPFGHGFWDSGNREDRSYLSPLEIIVDKKGKLAAINEVKLEEYVKGIVPVEIRLTAHDEALKAQAVSARTEAIAKLGIQHAFDPYDFCASQHCQEFGGLARRTSRTDAAVDATRGQVLMCDGCLVDAVYSANCGGHTENNENVWTSRPNISLRGVSDLYSNPDSFHFPLSGSQLSKWLQQSPRAYCGDPRVGDRSKFRWKVRYSPTQIKRIVNRYRRVGSVRDIIVLRRGVSGRALRIRIVGSSDTATVNKELQIRRVLGGLKSSMFTVDINRNSSGNPTSFVFYGGGWGHGVGLCQAGAEGMALAGFDYSDILKHYFSRTEIKQLYE